MKKILILLILCCGLSSFRAAAQEIKVKGFQRLERDLTARTKPRFDLNDTPCALVRVEVSMAKEFQVEGNVIGEPVYEKGEILVYMTRGSRRLTLKHEKYGVLRYEFPEKLEKQVVYELSLKLIEDKNNKLRTLVMPVFSYGAYEQMSYGLMVGIVKRTGGYVKVKTDFGSVSSDFEKDGAEANYWYTGSEKCSRFAITGGLLQRLGKMIYLYVGGGYGMRNYAKEIAGEAEGMEKPWVKLTDKSYKGFEAELGCIVRFGGVAVSAGVQTNRFKKVEGNVGVGIMF